MDFFGDDSSSTISLTCLAHSEISIVQLLDSLK